MSLKMRIPAGQLPTAMERLSKEGYAVEQLAGLERSEKATVRIAQELTREETKEVFNHAYRQGAEVYLSMPREGECLAHAINFCLHRDGSEEQALQDFLYAQRFLEDGGLLRLDMKAQCAIEAMMPLLKNVLYPQKSDQLLAATPEVADQLQKAIEEFLFVFLRKCTELQRVIRSIPFRKARKLVS